MKKLILLRQFKYIARLEFAYDRYNYYNSILQRDKSYLKDHWCQFDATMVLFLWLSVILQMFEMLGLVVKFSAFSVIRSPRPLIMIRFLRVFLKFSMPKARINQIFK